MKIWLFDIDGTLILSGGAGQEAAFATLVDAFSIETPDREQIGFAGRTDRAIVRDLFQVHDIEVTEENWDLFQRSYLQHLHDHLEKQEGEVLTGVLEAIEQLHACSRSHLGLLTGNIQAAAEAKLRYYELWDFFHFGGYGDHHVSRDNVAEVAFANACDHLNQSIDPRDVWVIGDTANDIRCAKAIGANSVAVATGGFSVDQLAEENPDFLLEDLSPSEIVAALLSVDEL